MIGVRGVAAGVAMLLWGVAPALAGPPPIGAWVSARGARLVVSDDATCAFVVPDGQAEGECIWRASDTGGVLTIQFPGQTADGTPREQVLYLDIRWINQLAIAVTGEVFRRTKW